jgi:predicted RNase H-like HicB family nuclease
MMRNYIIVVEKHPDTYVAYPLGLKGVVVGQGDTYDAVLSDINSAIKFHIETFGAESLRTILTQSGIPRDVFLRAFDQCV